MAQKLFAPFKKIPHQVQNLPFIKKAYDAHFGKFRTEMFGHLSTVFGFPEKPSALAHDPVLNLLAIGTRNGELRILGAPGVQFAAFHEDHPEVVDLLFIPDEGRLITLTGDNQLHYWEADLNVAPAVWKQLKTLKLPESDASRVTALHLSGDKSCLYVGTEAGSLRRVGVPSWVFDDDTVTTETITNLVSEEHRASLKFGAIVQVAGHPTQPGQLLIGYADGLAVVLDNTASEGRQVTHLLSWQQALESVCWQGDGGEVLTSYGDGSFLVWPIGHSQGGFVKNQEPPTTPYGPFPCNPITKILSKTSKIGNLTIFAGGMPRSTFGSRNTLSIMREQDHVCLNLSAPVLGFVSLNSAAPDCDPSTATSYDDPSALVILTEREILCVDLHSPGWPLIAPPYLATVDATCKVSAVGHLPSPPADLIGLLRAANHGSTMSSASWPISGGVDSRVGGDQAEREEDLLLTGHVDGCVRIWAVKYGGQVELLTSLNTGRLYQMEQPPADVKTQDGDWPPFRNVGLLNSPPTTSDTRLTVTSVAMVLITTATDDEDPTGCRYQLVVTGSAGQASVWRVAEVVPVALATCSVELDLFKGVDSPLEVVWTGPEALKVREVLLDAKTCPLVPTCLAQVLPPSSIVTASLRPQGDLLALGTGHGFVVVDPLRHSEVFRHNGLLHGKQVQQDSSILVTTRGQQFKKSLRHSFKRLKKLRPAPAADGEKAGEGKKEEGGPPSVVVVAASDTELATAENTEETAPQSKAEEVSPPAVQEEQATPAVEPTPAAPEVPQTVTLSPEDSLAHATRCLLFSPTNLLPEDRGSLWVGTGGGAVLAHSIQATAGEGEQAALVVVLTKELQLRHGASLVGLQVLEARSHAPVGLSIPKMKEDHQKSEPPLVEEAPAIEEADTAKTDPPAGEEPTTKPEVEAKTATPAEVETKAATPAPPALGSVHHELIICTEEQVKVFSLPLLKAKHKYKIPVGHQTSAAPVNGEHNSTSPRKTRHTTRHAVSFSIHHFTHPNSEVSHAEYDAVVALSDASFLVLSLPSLRKQAAGSAGDSRVLSLTQCSPGTTPIIISLVHEGLLQALDLSQHTPGRYGALCSLDLPDGMRPKTLTLEEEADMSALEDEKKAVEDAKKAAEEAEKESHEADKEAMGHAVEKLHAVTSEDSIFTDKTGHIGDITMDSIKEYITSGEGTVTVKRYENTTEKRTLVQAGQVTTLLHEREEIDGKVVKDDTVKVTGGGPPAIQSA